MRRAGSTRWGILVALVALTGSSLSWYLSGGAIFSPGGLNAEPDSTPLGGVVSHAALGTRCGACHAVPFSGRTMQGLCLECHTEITAELRDSASLHGSLAQGGSCISCHTEHHGPRASLTRLDGGGAGMPEGFLAGHVRAYGSACGACHRKNDPFVRRRFNHDSTAYPLTGAHFRVTCEECHAGTRDLAGFKNAPTDCNSCHQKVDKHRGGFGSDCASCHEPTSWEAASFEHSFPISHGGRGRVTCRTCHDTQGDWKRYTCYGCHEHTPARVAAEHREEGMGGRDLSDCVRCHSTGREHEGGEGHRGREGSDDD